MLLRKNCRVSPRFDSAVKKIRYQALNSGSSFRDGIMKNISETGAALEVGAESSPMEEIKIEFYGFDMEKPLELTGRVIWAKRQGNAWDIGIKFSNINEAQKEIINLMYYAKRMQNTKIINQFINKRQYPRHKIDDCYVKFKKKRLLWWKEETLLEKVRNISAGGVLTSEERHKIRLGSTIHLSLIFQNPLMEIKAIAKAIRREKDEMKDTSYIVLEFIYIELPAAQLQKLIVKH